MINFTILRFDRLASTNTEALEQARRGADEGLCVVARQQTAGRGRHGRAWLSPPDAGLYFSLVLRPRFASRRLPLITLTAGVAAHDALEEAFGVDCDLKWVNDLYVGEKKLGGILAETTDTAGGLAVVVGIGVNLRAANLPEEVNVPATSIENETGRAATAEELLPALTRHFAAGYETLCGADGPERTIAAWTGRSTYAFGKAVKVLLEAETFTGVTRGLAENGALLVETADGATRTVHAGDVLNLRRG